MNDAAGFRSGIGDWLPKEARSELDALLRLGVEGCLRHRVPTDYTNIAILNAGNLIVLGEPLAPWRTPGSPKSYIAAWTLCALTAVLGIHEFLQPNLLRHRY